MVNVYAIFDRKAEEFGPLMCVKNDAVAVRGFRQACKEVKEEEYRLYKLGEFDEVKGMLHSVGGHPVEVNTERQEEE